jgi:L-fuconolactonase
MVFGGVPAERPGRGEMIVDAHQHFWRYDAEEYDWIGDDLAAIRRDFLPADLEREIIAASVDAVISVQARQSLGETEWLLALAEQNAFVAGVVGWVPLTSPSIGETLGRLAANPRLRGVRHVLQGEADPDYAARPDFNAGIEALRQFGLVYDILIYERQLPMAIALVDRHPRQVFVLDHVAKPRIREGALSPWSERLRELARRPNVFCKLSGMVTEADTRSWTRETLAPYADVVLEAFGPSRVMFGSDWPVCLAACSYPRWLATVRELCGALSPSERDEVLGGTALRAYGPAPPRGFGAHDPPGADP